MSAAAGSNFIDAANHRIWRFVRRRRNSRLLPGTGHYSTPFRGTLFGEEASAAIAKALSRCKLDVLWLGTNPCVPRSLNYIVRPPRGTGDFPTFERQMTSGLFGSARWDSDGNRSRDWNPIERPTGNWRVYRDTLARIANLDSVAMANFLLWGSKNAGALVEKLSAADSSLLKRMFAFADDLNAEIVQALSPRLLVVPYSLGRNATIDAVHPLGVSLANAADVRRHELTLQSGAFTFYTGTCRRGRLQVPAVFLRHPSSLRVATDDKRRVVRGLVRVLEGGN